MRGDSFSHHHLDLGLRSFLRISHSVLEEDFGCYGCILMFGYLSLVLELHY